MRHAASIVAAFVLALGLELRAAAPGSAQMPDRADAAAARREGSLSWYTSTPFPLVQHLIDRFQQDTGIKVQLLRTGGQAVLRRFQQEAAAGRAGADVITMSDAGAANGLAKQGLFEPFRPEGFDKVVSEARDGVEALDQADRGAPDVIVLDLNLPGLSGYDVLQRLRAHPATATVPVVVLTAKGDEDNEVRVFELGADDFLTKPFRARALSARLEAVLGRRRP